MTIAEAIEEAERLQDAADKAFEKWMLGRSKSASGAARVQALAEEKAADVRFHPDYNPGKHGEGW